MANSPEELEGQIVALRAFMAHLALRVAPIPQVYDDFLKAVQNAPIPPILSPAQSRGWDELCKGLAADLKIIRP